MFVVSIASNINSYVIDNSKKSIPKKPYGGLFQ
jgi:hypothetical protein